MGESSRVVKRLLSCCRQRLSRNLTPGQIQRGSSKASKLQSLLAVLEGETFEEIINYPSLGASQPVEAVSQIDGYPP